PQLLNALKNATRFERVLISQRKAGGKAGRSGDYFWIIELRDVLISSLQWSAQDSGPTGETLMLTYYDGITVEYFKQNPDGTLVKSAIAAEITLEDTLKGKDGKDGKDGTGKSNGSGQISETQVQSVVKRVVQEIKSRNPGLNIRA